MNKFFEGERVRISGVAGGVLRATNYDTKTDRKLTVTLSDAGVADLGTTLALGLYEYYIIDPTTECRTDAGFFQVSSSEDLELVRIKEQIQLFETYLAGDTSIAHVLSTADGQSMTRMTRKAAEAELQKYRSKLADRLRQKQGLPPARFV